MRALTFCALRELADSGAKVFEYESAWSHSEAFLYRCSWIDYSRRSLARARERLTAGAEWLLGSCDLRKRDSRPPHAFVVGRRDTCGVRHIFVRKRESKECSPKLRARK